MQVGVAETKEHWGETVKVNNQFTDNRAADILRILGHKSGVLRIVLLFSLHYFSLSAVCGNRLLNPVIKPSQKGRLNKLFYHYNRVL